MKTVWLQNFFRRVADNTMATLFEWEGVQNNSRIRGKCFAESMTDLANQLGERKILLCSARRRITKHKLSNKQANFVLEQLFALLRAGIPILKTLEIITSNEKSPRLVNALEQIKQEISAGSKLSDAIAMQLPDREKTTAKILALGEHNGCLIITMERLLKQKQKEREIRDQFVQATIYPLFLGIVSFSVMLLLTVWVVPEFKQTYSGMGAELPFYTRVTIAISEIIVERWLFVVTIIGMAIMIIMALLRYSKSAKWFLSRLQLQLPILGSLLSSYFCHHFASNMRTAYQSGMPLSDSLAWLPQTSAHPGYRAALKSIQADTHRGVSLHQAIKNSAFFPTIVEQFISIGEHSGSLDDALKRIEQHFAERLEITTKHFLKIFEPAMITLIALCVGWIVITMYLPIFNLGYVL